VWPAAVVVVEKGVELKLQLSEGMSSRLLAEKAFKGLVEAFDLATGLGVIWRRVLKEDAQAF
jgi:hypothetical protein